MPTSSERHREEITNITADLHGRVSQLESDVTHLDRNITVLNSKIDNLTTLITKEAKTNWSTLGTWAAVLLALVGMWTAPMMTRVFENTSAIEKGSEDHIEHITTIAQQNTQVRVLEAKLGHLQSEYNEHIKLVGHPGMMREFARLEAEVIAIKSNLFTEVEGTKVAAKLEQLEKTIRDIREEQARRTEKVYRTPG